MNLTLTILTLSLSAATLPPPCQQRGTRSQTPAVTGKSGAMTRTLSPVRIAHQDTQTLTAP
ncbi:MAG: hypothetical protein ACK56K_10320 [Akkermansiaceae bacterium]|nr:hypothetical protein [Luteolibacter sp.]